MKPLRCAVYTRKSNEEGLDLAFNSLDAQREAGLDYIKSQKHEGWEAVKTVYSDGGISGGTMKRPGLQQLLEDIDKGRIDVVVVYKVDRLSRSLTDFAKIMELFDEKQVSFVSVTQQFNTSTSMGRLTMNMLLSFAQFEREVSGERIRDKIAATKKKGYWVGGQPPLGYRLQEEHEAKGIYIIPDEAELVKLMFEKYIEFGSPLAVVESLTNQGFTTKRWVSKSGRVHGGKPLSTKYVHGILTNQLYIGKITHSRNGKTDVYEGLHTPIIDQAIWVAAQRAMKKLDKSELHRWTHPHLLKGKVRTSDGFMLSPSSTHRPLTKRTDTKQKRLVRYYISQRAIKHGFKSCPIKTINANQLDDLIRGLVLGYLQNDEVAKQPQEYRDSWVRRVIESVTVAEDSISVTLSVKETNRLQSHRFPIKRDTDVSYPTCLYQPDIQADADLIKLTLSIQIKKLDGRRMLLSPDGNELIMPSNPEPQRHIVDAIGLAYRWHDELIKTGLKINEYATKHCIARSRIIKLLPLTQLGPEVLKHALAGTLASTITLEDLIRASKQLEWSKQASELGLKISA